MAIYSNKEYSGADSFTAFQCTNFTESSMCIVAEAQENYNAIMKAIGIQELSVFESTGAEMIYEAVDFKAIVGKIKAFFVNLLGKVKAIFEKFMAMINSYILDDKKFLAKYEAKIKENWAKVKNSFEMSGYVFTALDEDTLKEANACADSEIKYKLSDFNGNNKEKAWLQSIIEYYSDEDEIKGKMRGAIVGCIDDDNKAVSIEAKDFAEALFRSFRSGEAAKDTLTGADIDINACITDLKNAADTKKVASANFTSIDTIIKGEIAEIDKVSNEISKAKDWKVTGDNGEEQGIGFVTSAITKILSVYKFKSDCLVLTNGALMTAIKDRSRQYKAICAAVATATEKKAPAEEAKTESADFLAGVVLK